MTVVVALDGLDAAARARLGNRAPGAPEAAAATAAATVLEEVQRGGDEAICAFMARVDGARLTPDRLLVEPDAVAAAENRVDPILAEAMRRTVRNLERFHRAQRPEAWSLEVEPGVVVGERFPPVRAAGLYVPFGTAVYPSTALMLTVPARIAGVERIVLASGVDPGTGEIPAAVIAAAALGGASELWRVSGPAAVAAFAFGTQTLRPVDVIAGPGGRYVEAAKRLVRGRVGVDFDAGPSEVLVLALDGADPDVAAADLLSEAEHGEASCGLVVTPDRALAARIDRCLEARLEQLPGGRAAAVRAQLEQGRSAIVVVADPAAAVAFAEEVAAEHVIVHSAVAAEEIASKLRSAGTVCVGSFTPSPAGSYVAGTNHVLPTGGAARHAGGLSTTHFQRRQSFERLTRDGLVSLRPAIAAYAEQEGLPAHLAAVDARLA